MTWLQPPNQIYFSFDKLLCAYNFFSKDQSGGFLKRNLADQGRFLLVVCMAICEESRGCLSSCCLSLQCCRWKQNAPQQVGSYGELNQNKNKWINKENNPEIHVQIHVFYIYLFMFLFPYSFISVFIAIFFYFSINLFPYFLFFYFIYVFIYSCISSSIC